MAINMEVQIPQHVVVLESEVHIDGFTETNDGEMIGPEWSADLQTYWVEANAHDGNVLLYGRRAFEYNSSFWPAMAENPDQPAGFREYPLDIPEARYDPGLGEFLLPYEEVRRARDPDATLLRFLQTTYEAAANLAGWDRAALERDGGLIKTT